MADLLLASLVGASQMGKMVYDAVNRAWVLTDLPPESIDDGWEIIGPNGDPAEDGGDEALKPEPNQNQDERGAPQSSQPSKKERRPDEATEAHLIQRFRAAEKELRSAITLQDKASETTARRKLSDCRRDIACWERARIASEWSTETIVGGPSPGTKPKGAVSIVYAGEALLMSPSENDEVLALHELPLAVPADQAIPVSQATPTASEQEATQTRGSDKGKEKASPEVLVNVETSKPEQTEQRMMSAPPTNDKSASAEQPKEQVSPKPLVDLAPETENAATKESAVGGLRDLDSQPKTRYLRSRPPTRPPSAAGPSRGSALSSLPIGLRYTDPRVTNAPSASSSQVQRAE
ncbi:hypothetical protein OQA88_9145 [Cercophora sp. LCS_1]